MKENIKLAIQEKLEKEKKRVDEKLYLEKYVLMRESYNRLENLLSDNAKEIFLKYSEYLDACNEIARCESFVIGFEEGVNFLYDLLEI